MQCTVEPCTVEPCAVEQPASSLQPTPQLTAFVNRLNRNKRLYAGPDRRIDCRQPVVLPVVVRPIDEQGRPLAPPLAMVTRDVSTWGVGLVHEQPLFYDRLALRMIVDGEEVNLVGEVRWREPLGPFYMCGCKVVAKLFEFPTWSASVVGSPQKHCRTDPPATTWQSSELA